MAIIWSAFRVATLDSMGGRGRLGRFKGHALCQTGLEEFLHRDLSLSFRAQCLPQMETSAGFGAVAQTQGYYLVCISGSLVK